jgi:VanZ family protein
MKDFNKIILLSFFAVCSIIGFMIKLPRTFHTIDKELHFLFYFITTIVILFLFPKKRLILVTCLVIFGIVIELAQEFSNKISFRLIGKAIHGRFDIEDVKYNFFGVVLGLLIIYAFRFLIKKLR